MKSTLRSFLLAILLVGVFSPLSQAEEMTTKESKVEDPQDKIQMHEHMAEMYKKAADCLRSGKTEVVCHDAMMTECKDMKGKMDCPMMSDMKTMHKNMHAKMKKGKMSSDKMDAEHHP